MQKAEAIAKLQQFEPHLRALGAAGLYLFGSTARGEATAASDVDLFMDIEKGHRFTLLDLAAAQRLLGHGLGTPVDLTTRDGLHPLVRDKILQDAERIF